MITTPGFKTRNEWFRASIRSFLARKYIARGVTEELIIEYHSKGYSLLSICLT